MGRSGLVGGILPLLGTQNWTVYISLSPNTPIRPFVFSQGRGTGKTYAMMKRIARLLEDEEVPPEQILAVTFNNFVRAVEIATELLRSKRGSE